MIGIISSSILYDMYKVVSFVAADAFDTSFHSFDDNGGDTSPSQETTCSSDSGYPGSPPQDIYYDSSDEYEYENGGDVQFRVELCGNVQECPGQDFLSYIKNSTIGDQVSSAQFAYVRELSSSRLRHNSIKNGGIQVL